MAEVTLSGLLSSLKSGVDPEVTELLHQEVHTIISGEDGGAEKTTVGFLKSFPGLRYFEGHLQIEQAADLTWLLSGHLELGSLELEISPGVVGLEEQLALSWKR